MAFASEQSVPTIRLVIANISVHRMYVRMFLRGIPSCQLLHIVIPSSGRAATYIQSCTNAAGGVSMSVYVSIPCQTPISLTVHWC